MPKSAADDVVRRGAIRRRQDVVTTSASLLASGSRGIGAGPESHRAVTAWSPARAITGVKANYGNGARSGTGDPASVKDPLIRLKQLLETDDGEAADFIIDAKPRLAGVLTSTEIRTLSDRVGNFDFDAALKCLSGIASRLSLNLEGK